MEQQTQEQSKQQRHHLGSKEKIAILRKHLLEGVPVSDLCDQHRMHPTAFYQWQKQLFENGEAAFERRSPSSSAGREKQTILALEDKLKRKAEVLSELMEEHIALKKSLGEI